MVERPRVFRHGGASQLLFLTVLRSAHRITLCNLDRLALLLVRAERVRALLSWRYA